ncbi:MAG: hypothetical protein IPJ04_01760 [Candidatus Eisenbacteria bacterium]|nr:hypothetical protein [Candidatus Eisenbacteria bacterium]
MASERRSFHTTNAPPEPSGTIAGFSCSAVAAHSARPAAGQAGSVAPVERTRCA